MARPGLNLTGPPAWTDIHPTNDPGSSTESFAEAYDPRRDRMILFGFASCGTHDNCDPFTNLTYMLTWETPVTAIAPAIETRIGSAITFAAESRPRSSCDRVPNRAERRGALDGSVRRRRPQGVGTDDHRGARSPASGVGRPWNGRSPGAPGVYFARLVTARGTATTRFVRID